MIAHSTSIRLLLTGAVLLAGGVIYGLLLDGSGEFAGFLMMLAGLLCFPLALGLWDGKDQFTAVRQEEIPRYRKNQRKD